MPNVAFPIVHFWRVSVGILVIVLALVVQRIAARRIFAEWRASDRRAWASVVRPARRAWPFSAFIWSHISHYYEHQWFLSTPAWIHESSTAQTWLRIYRCVAVLIPVGF